jgi:hypothetical protein
MPRCILCGSEAREATAEDSGKLVSCPQCHSYRLADGLAADLTKEAPQFRRNLARALRWRFYKGEPGEPLVRLRDIISAEWLIETLKEFEEDPDKRECEAVDALVSAGAMPDALGIPVMRLLGRALGLSHDESCAYAKKLLARKVVRIVPGHIGLTLPPDVRSFGRSEQWERCEEKDGERSEGSK